MSEHQHKHVMTDITDPSVFWTQEFWDERYSTSGRIWSGNPNQRLVEQVSHLTPGTALDVGCGEGGDAIWLAAQGWRVTAMDVSPVALARGAEEAAKAGPEIANRITWKHVDMLTWDLASEQFDLVSAHYIHLPSQQREVFHTRLGSAVRPGGTLLIVGHHPSDLEKGIRRPNFPDLMFTAEQIVESLPSDAWEVHYAGAPERSWVDPEGQTATISDAVFRATRRA